MLRFKDRKRKNRKNKKKKNEIDEDEVINTNQKKSVETTTINPSQKARDQPENSRKSESIELPKEEPKAEVVENPKPVIITEKKLVNQINETSNANPTAQSNKQNLQAVPAEKVLTQEEKRKLKKERRTQKKEESKIY